MTQHFSNPLHHIRCIPTPLFRGDEYLGEDARFQVDVFWQSVWFDTDEYGFRIPVFFDAGASCRILFRSRKAALDFAESAVKALEDGQHLNTQFWALMSDEDIIRDDSSNGPIAEEEEDKFTVEADERIRSGTRSCGNPLRFRPIHQNTEAPESRQLDSDEQYGLGIDDFAFAAFPNGYPA